MKWLDNFTLIMRSSISAIKEKVEDPERMLHQLLVDMEEELEGVRDSVADAIADEIQLGKRAEAAHRESKEWSGRSEAALKRGDERACRGAIEQKLLAEERAAALDASHEKQREETAKLQRAVNELQEKIGQARQKRTLLLARLTRAESTTRIQKGLEQAAAGSAFAQFNRLESRVERAEAKSEAYDRLEGRDPAADELKADFEKRERDAKLQAELEELRRRLKE